MKRPKEKNYYTKDYGSNQDAMFLNRYIEDWNKWADEAEQQVEKEAEIWLESTNRLNNRIKELEEWKSKVAFLWQKYKRAKGDITANQSSVEEFERMLQKALNK